MKNIWFGNRSTQLLYIYLCQKAGSPSDHPQVAVRHGDHVAVKLSILSILKWLALGLLVCNDLQTDLNQSETWQHLMENPTAEDGILSLRKAEDELWQNGSPLDHAALDEQVSICRTIQNNFHLKKNKQCIYVVREEISTLPERKFSDSLKKVWNVPLFYAFEQFQRFVHLMQIKNYTKQTALMLLFCVIWGCFLFQTFELFNFFVSTH